MAMTPMIIIGCGGSGGKVIASLRQSLKVQLQHLGWEEGIPEAWQLIYVDTPAAQEVDLTYGPAVPAADYISLSQGIGVYANVDEAVMNVVGTENIERFLGWRPSPQVPIPVNLGAGQWRAVGRMAAFNGLPAVARRFERALAATNNGVGQLERLGALLQDDAPIAGPPLIIVVSSLAGGTGAGVYLDVADVIRTTHPALSNRIMGVLFTAEVFRNLPGVPGVQPNTLAALCEMMSGYFDLGRSTEPAYKGTVHHGVANVGKTGVNFPFVVGMSTISGRQLERIPDAYRSVTETLAAMLLSPEACKWLTGYYLANWPVKCSPNTTSWGFGNGSRPDGLNVESPVVSSFGSARLSVGSLRFSEYSSHRLARSVIEYLADGYIEYGRGLMNDPQATPQQIIDYFVTRNGMSFIEACGLRELNDAVEIEHNQVLDGMIESSRLDEMWRDWWGRLYAELQASTPRPQQPGNWLRQVQQLVPLRQQGFLGAVADELATGEAKLVERLPEKLLEQVSANLAQYGVPITLELVRFAVQHVREAVNELRREAANERNRGAKWQQSLMEVLQRLPAKSDIPGSHQGIQEAVRYACSGGYREARSLARERASQFLQRFIDQVLARVEAQLTQIQGQLAGPDARAAVSPWPGDQGVPAMFAPPPLEFCLIDPEQWSTIYDRLLRETASDEPGPAGSAAEVARRAVGGGGFRVEKQGRSEMEPPALRLAEPWTSAPITLEVSLDVEAIHERARIWLNRTGTVFGDYLGQRLGSYLSGNINGRAVADFQSRIDRFRDGLQSTLASATPMVEIDPVVMQRVHPRSPMRPGLMTELLPEQLPITAPVVREHAERILTPYLAPGQTVSQFFGDGTFDVESVLYVSFLLAPVHPAVVSSLVRPIGATWNRVRMNRDSVSLYWENRRARRLDEFVPVTPHVLDLMIRGWIVGRLLGRISDPDPANGFRIAYVDENLGQTAHAVFPWPLLHWGRQAFLADVSMTREWLPALLESLGIGFALFESQPEILRGYDELYNLGGSPAMSHWIMTGETGPASRAPLLKGSDLVSRRESALELLRAFVRPYQEDLKNTRVVANPGQFLAIRYGFDLFERIVSQADILIAEAAGIDDVVGIVG